MLLRSSASDEHQYHKKPNAMKSPMIKYIAVTLILLAAVLIATLPMKTYGQLPQPLEKGGVTYITGGVGEDEAKAIKVEAKNWPLNIEFSQYLGSHDAWVSQVYLTILDAKGDAIFEAHLDGPMFLVKLPSGHYEIVATYEGVTKKLKIQIVAGRPLHVSINWRLSKSGDR
jgi:hypothetical protein